MKARTGGTIMAAADRSETGKPSVRVSRIIRGPRERVFEAWLKPEIRRQWWVTHSGEGLTSCEIEARVGGRYCQKQIGGCSEEPDPNFEWIMEGEFVEIVEPERLVFTWNVNHDPPVVDSRVTIEFKEVAEGTEVVLTHEGLATAQLRDGTHEGWTKLLGHIAEVLERA